MGMIKQCRCVRGKETCKGVKRVTGFPLKTKMWPAEKTELNLSPLGLGSQSDSAKHPD